MEIQTNGLTPARVKRAELDRLNNEQTPLKYTVKRTKRGDDDDSGGVRPVLPP